MEQEKTHWKKLVNPNYIGAYSMPTDGSEIILTIKNVVREMVSGEGGKKEECTVAYFVEPSKPMILNRTNCKAISKAHGSSYIEDWSNKPIQIFVAKVKVAGDVVDALRVRDYSPKQAEKVNPFAELIKVISADIQGIEDLKELEKYWNETKDKHNGIGSDQETKSIVTKRIIELKNKA